MYEDTSSNDFKDRPYLTAFARDQANEDAAKSRWNCVDRDRRKSYSTDDILIRMEPCFSMKHSHRHYRRVIEQNKFFNQP